METSLDVVVLIVCVIFIVMGLAGFLGNIVQAILICLILFFVALLLLISITKDF